MNIKSFKPLATDFLSIGGSLSADTSSIILLSKVNQLHEFSAVKQMLISGYVYKELVSYNNNKNMLYKILFNNNTIRVVKTLPKSIETVNKLSTADASVILLHFEYKTQGILSDDGKICAYCKNNNITYINTPIALYLLLHNRLINYVAFTIALHDVYRLGRYSQSIQDYMKELLHDFSNKKL
jgi:predicted nucleic acid-binding protein